MEKTILLNWLGAQAIKWGLDKAYSKSVEGIKILLKRKAINKRVDKDSDAEADIVKQLKQLAFKEQELKEQGKCLSDEEIRLRKVLEDQLREVSSKNDSNFFN